MFKNIDVWYWQFIGCHTDLFDTGQNSSINASFILYHLFIIFMIQKTKRIKITIQLKLKYWWKERKKEKEREKKAGPDGPTTVHVTVNVNT